LALNAGLTLAWFSQGGERKMRMTPVLIWTFLLFEIAFSLVP
jgi:hypothetical protein